MRILRNGYIMELTRQEVCNAWIEAELSKSEANIDPIRCQTLKCLQELENHPFLEEYLSWKQDMDFIEKCVDYARKAIESSGCDTEFVFDLSSPMGGFVTEVMQEAKQWCQTDRQNREKKEDAMRILFSLYENHLFSWESDIL